MPGLLGSWIATWLVPPRDILPPTWRFHHRSNSTWMIARVLSVLTFHVVQRIATAAARSCFSVMPTKSAWSCKSDDAVQGVMLLAVQSTLTTAAINSLWVIEHTRHLAEACRDWGVQLIEYLEQMAARIPAHRSFSVGPQTKHLDSERRLLAVQVTGIWTRIARYVHAI